MIALIQRVKKASVSVSNKVISKIDKGILILLGIKSNDTVEDIDYLVSKITDLRIMSEDNDLEDHFSKSIKDQHLKALVVSQFTLYADLRKGTRPSFINAMNSKDAKILYEEFNTKLKEKGIEIETGEFGALMEVELINDGPVTFSLTSDHLKVKNT